MFDHMTQETFPCLISDKILPSLILSDLILSLQPGEEVDHPGRPRGPRLDREPEHGAGRQQEALPDEWGDRPPLLLDADAVRGV